MLIHGVTTAMMLTALIQVVLPLVVGLVTRLTTHPGLKAVLLLVLTSANQFFVGWLSAIGHGQFNWVVYLFNVLLGFLISVGMHFGIWRPTTVTDVAQNSLVK